MLLDRRNLVKILAGTGAACLCGHPVLARSSASGCFMSAAQAKTFSVNLIEKTGNPILNQSFRTDARALVHAFGVRPTYMFYDDSAGSNAFASPAPVYEDDPDGLVVFGLNFLEDELARDERGWTVLAILAHEFAHILQFKLGIDSDPVKRAELHADYLAGWYLGRWQNQVNWADVGPAMATFYSLGDYAFNSADSHGTPRQRLAAVKSGLADTQLELSAAVEKGWALFANV